MTSPFDLDDRETTAAKPKEETKYIVCTQKSGWKLWTRDAIDRRSDRTDTAGRFLFEIALSAESETVIHFASADFSRQAIYSFRGGDVDEPLDITLRSVRPARFGVIGDPRDDPVRWLDAEVYSVDSDHGRLAYLPAFGGNGAHWAGDRLESSGSKGLWTATGGSTCHCRPAATE